MKIAYKKDLQNLTDSIAAKIKARFLNKSNLDSAVSAHNSSSTSHEDIRDLISTLINRLNAMADSDDETLDQLSEIVAYIKSNKDLIESVTTSKVSVSAIVDSLVSIATDKPLSANQGKVLKGLIDELQSSVEESVEDLKKSVSDGKELVADAITEKGVTTAADATFSTMAENIGLITSGPVENEINLQDKTVKPKEEIAVVTPDDGYDGLSQVTVLPIQLADFSMNSFITTNPNEKRVGTITDALQGEDFDGIKQVELSGVLVQSKTVTPKDAQQIITPDDGYDVLSSVTVSAVKLQAKTVTPTASQQTVKADSGYNGLSQVVVNAQEATTPKSVTLVGKVGAILSGAPATVTKAFSVTIPLPFNGTSISLGKSTCSYGTAATSCTGSASITGISFEQAASISMIAEHFGVDEDLAEQIYDMDEFMIEVEEDTLEVGNIDKAQKIAQTIQAINETNSINKEDKVL